MTGSQMKDIHIYRFEGPDSVINMQNVMKMFRFGFRTIGGCEVESVRVLRKGEEGEMPADVLEYRLAGGPTLLIRPNEPEITLEVSLAADGENKEMHEMELRIWNDIENIIYIDYRAGYCCE